MFVVNKVESFFLFCWNSEVTQVYDRLDLKLPSPTKHDLILISHEFIVNHYPLLRILETDQQENKFLREGDLIGILYSVIAVEV